MQCGHYRSRKDLILLHKNTQDIMGPAKDFLSDIQADEADLIESMRKAFDIFWARIWPLGITAKPKLRQLL